MQETDKIIVNAKEVSEFGRNWRRERQCFRLRTLDSDYRLVEEQWHPAG